MACSHSAEVKVFDPASNLQTSVAGFREHQGTTYCSRWSPHFANTFMTCSGDGTAKIFDLNSSIASGRSVLTINASPGEVLSCDWNKYDSNIIATCGATADPFIKLWDLRKTAFPMKAMPGHRFGIRKVKFSPHDASTLASASYDMSVKVWNWNLPQPCVASYEHHNEFVFGLDFSLFAPGEIVSASWVSF